MVVGDDIWVAGQIGIDGGDSMAEQAASALSKIDALLGEAGADKADLVMVMVLLEDMAEFGEFNEVYAAWLEGTCLLYTSPSPRDGLLSRMPSSA